MAASQAERPATPPAQASAAAPWASLGWRQILELTVPGVAIGLLTGVIAGGLSAFGGLAPHVAVFTGIALAVPLALGGAGYEIMLARGTFPLSVLTPVALYWAVLFPVGRVIEAGLVDLYAGSALAVPHGWLDYVIYQAIVSVGFGIGYWWLHENFAPLWWFHIRERNPVADNFVRVQLAYAEAAEAKKERRRQEQETRRAKKRRR